MSLFLGYLWPPLPTLIRDVINECSLGEIAFSNSTCIYNVIIFYSVLLCKAKIGRQKMSNGWMISFPHSRLVHNAMKKPFFTIAIFLMPQVGNGSSVREPMFSKIYPPWDPLWLSPTLSKSRKTFPYEFWPL